MNPETYEAHKTRMGELSRERSAAGRDIGDIPAVVNPERRAMCERDFQMFCEFYFPRVFFLNWSEDHLTAIEKIEAAMLEGAQFAFAMPRGQGKTTLCWVGALWAMLYGHRKFLVIIASGQPEALKLLDKMKLFLKSSKKLLDDFPEAVYPIQKLEGQARRCQGQTHNGVLTEISMTANEIALPVIKGSKCSGARVAVAGITGTIRGQNVGMFGDDDDDDDGTIVRPDMVIVDDPQTDESAASASQTEKRLRIIQGTISGLAGPKTKMACLIPCTIIAPNDLSSRVLDREKYPEWNGQITKLIISFPTNVKLWEEYAAIRSRSLREHSNIKPATEFYRKNQEAMDLGGRASWRDRFNNDEISAIQHAMNLKLTDERAFWAEYQNEPLALGHAETLRLDPQFICEKLNNCRQWELPPWASTVVGFMDVHKTSIWYAVCAFADEFTGAVIDWGTYPAQNIRYPVLGNLNVTLQDLFPNAALEGQVFAGITACADHICGRTYKTSDGGAHRLERCLVDAGWQADVVFEACRASAHAAILLPSHGHAIKAGRVPMDKWAKKKGEQTGTSWRISRRQKRAGRSVIFDSNYWKTFAASRVLTAMGDHGCLSVWGKNPDRHQCLADNLAAEMSQTATVSGATVEEWTQEPGRDNHLFDALVGCHVAASICGCRLKDGTGIGETARKAERAKRVSFADRQAKAATTGGRAEPGRTKRVSFADRQKARRA